MSFEPYVWLKWLHILSGAALLGTGFGTVLHVWAGHRTRKVRVIASVLRAALKLDRRVILSAGIVQPLTGLGLVIVTHTAVNASWLVVSYGLYLLAFACWIWSLILQAEALRLAEEVLADDAPPIRYTYHEAMKRWIVVVWPGLAALVVIFWLMIAKPAFW